jgi:hypothetical protein
MQQFGEIVRLVFRSLVFFLGHRKQLSDSAIASKRTLDDTRRLARTIVRGKNLVKPSLREVAVHAQKEKCDQNRNCCTA